MELQKPVRVGLNFRSFWGNQNAIKGKRNNCTSFLRRFIVSLTNSSISLTKLLTIAILKIHRILATTATFALSFLQHTKVKIQFKNFFSFAKIKLGSVGVVAVCVLSKLKSVTFLQKAINEQRHATWSKSPYYNRFFYYDPIKQDRKPSAILLNRQIFYLMTTLRTTISGILLKLGPIRPFWKLFRCEKYFQSQPAHMGVGPHPIFQLTV